MCGFRAEATVTSGSRCAPGTLVGSGIGKVSICRQRAVKRRLNNPTLRTHACIQLKDASEVGVYVANQRTQVSATVPASISNAATLKLNTGEMTDHSTPTAVLPVDGFLFAYQVHTKYGTFVVKGTDLLRVRAREIAATAKLEEIGGAETVVESAGRTALRPLATVKDLVTAPGKTVEDTFSGVGHLFGSVDASMSATDPHREGVIASVTGGSTARRRLAFDFGVDPHTTFEPLSAELTRLATASAVGKTATNAGLAFVTGGAGIAISVGGTSNTLRAALRDKTAADLEKAGRQSLGSMGISDATVNAFYANPWLTP
jgi:hypothetical protein